MADMQRFDPNNMPLDVKVDVDHLMLVIATWRDEVDVNSLEQAIRQQMKENHYGPAYINDAIRYAYENAWMAEPWYYTWER